MADDRRPTGTPRDELLARVVTRGRRIRLVRRTAGGLVAVALAGVGVFGIGVIDQGSVARLPGTGDGTEQVATGRPGGGVTDGTTAPAPAPGSITSTTGSGAAGQPTSPAGTPSTSPASGSGSPVVSTTVVPDGPSTTVPASRPGTGSGVPVPSTSTTSTPSTSTPDTTPIEIDPAPAVGVLRMSGDRLFESWHGVCESETDLIVSVAIAGADSATLSWNFGAGSTSVPMTFDGELWSGQVGPFAPDSVSAATPLAVIVTATGPGGTSRMASSVDLLPCVVP